MDLSQLLRAVLRRWYIALPLVLLAATLAVVVRGGVQPGYTVTANVIVLPPGAARVVTPDGVQVQEVNPLLNFNSSTQVAAKALTILASGPEFQARLAEAGELATYSVTAPPREPILEILVESKDRALALEVGRRVIAELQTELDRQQPVQRPEERLALQVLAAPGVAGVDNSRLRAFVVTLAVGIILALVLTVLVDGLASRRGHSKSRRHGAATEDSPPGFRRHDGEGEAGGASSAPSEPTQPSGHVSGASQPAQQ